MIVLDRGIGIRRLLEGHARHVIRKTSNVDCVIGKRDQSAIFFTRVASISKLQVGILLP